MTNDSLADVFNQYDASDVTVVTDMNTGRSRGFGFVTVPSSAVADEAIAALDGADVDGRAIRVNVSVAREDRPQRAPRDGGARRGYDFDGRKVYFGNLSWGMDDASLGDLFGEYDASEMTVVRDNESGRSRGFGFVTLADQASADKAIAALDGVVRAPPPESIHRREFRPEITNATWGSAATTSS